MNSAVMPEDAIYRRTLITENEFKTLVTSAKNIYSSIGYEEVSSHIQKVTGVVVPVNRGITKFYEKEGVLVVCRLKFRPEAYMKGKIKAKKDDYEYIRVDFVKLSKLKKCKIPKYLIHQEKEL